MKKSRKIKIIILVLVIIICIILLMKKSNMFKNLSEDILFLRNFQQGKSQVDNQIENHKVDEEEYDKEIIKTNARQYLFDLKCENTDFKNVNLLETLSEETLINEKIAPGVEGTFDIVLTSNEDTHYKVIFQSQNDKPRNLKFKEIESERELDSLEEFNSTLMGILPKDRDKTITIYWYWEYENTKEGNIQDTKDSKNIENYNFTICAIGEKIV